MLFKVFTVCAFLAAFTHAKEVRLTNKKYGAAMLFGLGKPVITSLEHDDVESVEWWHAEESGGYNLFKLENTFSESWASISGEQDIVAGLTEDDADTFFFQPAENGAFLIKVPDADSVWDVQPDATSDECLKGAVRMAPQNGKESQRWYIEMADD